MKLALLLARARSEAKRLGVGGEYYSCPVGVGNRVFVGSARGTMFVLASGDKLDVIAKNDLGEGIYATPAVIDNTMYVRTTRHLWAVAETQASKIK